MPILHTSDGSMDDRILSYADAVIHLITALGLDTMIVAACPATWKYGSACLRSADPSEQLLGYRLVLTALLSTPDGPQTLIARLERRLAGHG